VSAPYRIRAPERSELGAVTALIRTLDVALYGLPDFTEDDLREEWSAPRFDPARDAWVAPSASGALMGYGWLHGAPDRRDFNADVLVPPGPDRLRIARALLDAVESRAREAAAADPAGLSIDVPSVDRTKMRFLHRRGYRRARTFLRMTVDVAEDWTAPSPPPPIEIRTFRAGRDEGVLHTAMEEAFADHYRFTPESPADWLLFRSSHPNHDPDLWLVAWDGAEVAGGLVAYDLGELGWVREIGVRTPWRGRGLGRALLGVSFERFAARGRRVVSLGVDAENATGALALYERLGMRLERRHELLRRAIRR